MAGISLKRVFYTVLVIGFVVVGLVAINVEQLLKSFLLWLKNDVGVWGPVIMALAYIPLNILALPGAILTLGGGYVFGLLVGFVADSLGSTAGATAAFLVGKTIGRSYVSAKLKEYPQFQPVAHAISKSGFKIVLLLRLVPILPFNVMNYVLSVTPISLSSYVLASWIGMMPITFTFVYLGTTIKDISEIGSPGAAGASQWVILLHVASSPIFPYLCLQLTLPRMPPFPASPLPCLYPLPYLPFSLSFCPSVMVHLQWMLGAGLAVTSE
ncbi:unnamed protein product [Closterium sp. NIES-64]|nr:unnamed protein product [Closterium sp. NIES-64]